MTAMMRSVIFIDAHIFKQTTHQNVMFQKKQGKYKRIMAKIACFLALLKGLRLHNTCKQGNKYMKMCRAILCINICNVFHKGVTG